MIFWSLGMFKKNFNHIQTGCIDLRPFWQIEEFDNFKIAIEKNSVQQILYTKSNTRFSIPGYREVLFSLPIPDDKINFLLPVQYDKRTGWDTPNYNIEFFPSSIWEYPSYVVSEWDTTFKSNNHYWKLISIGFPDTKNKWEVPKFKINTLEGDYRLSIYSNGQQFSTASNLKNIEWTINSYCLPVF